MLQIRIRHRLPALTMIAFYMCLALLTVSCGAQNLAGRSCQNTVNFLEASGQSQVPRNEIYDSLKDETLTGGVCKLDKTCCSGSAESTFKTMSSVDYKQKIQNMLISTLMPCHNHSFLGEFINFIRASKVNLVSNMRTVFSFYFTPYENIFDEFYNYLETSVMTGDLCNVEQQFTKISFEVFLAAYTVSSTVSRFDDVLPNTHDFRQCLFDFFLDLRGEKVSTELNGLLRAYNLTMRYVRALKLIDNVIEGILALSLTEQCQDALMKMTYCSQCAGYNGNLLPCQGLCMNTLRGCLVDFIDLIEPLQEMSNALVALNKVLEKNNPWDQITILNSYFSRTATETQRGVATIREDLFTQCDQNGATNRNRRSSAAAAPAPAPANSERAPEIAESVRDRRMVARAAPPAPYAAINQSAYCITRAIPLFTNMAEDLCGREGVGRINTKCWTGLTYGSYERSIVDLNRFSQRNNPELVVCTRQSRVRKQLAQLHYITRELNILSGVQACSSDDEDCIDTVPHTCNYFQFPDSYEYEYELDTGSGSGSGSDNESEGSEDACAEGAPIIISGPDTTDRLESSGAETLSSTMMSLLTLVLFAAVSSMFMTSSNR